MKRIIAVFLLLVLAGAASGSVGRPGRVVVRNRTVETLHLVVRWGPIVQDSLDVAPGERAVVRDMPRDELWSAEVWTEDYEYAGRTFGYEPRRRQPLVRRWLVSPADFED